MEVTGVNDVDITTFVNPHLFWIIVKNKERIHLLNNLNKDLQADYCEKNHESRQDTFEIGEIVAAKINDKIYRAIIEDIDSENIANISYLLWLVDFGTLRESNTVLKLPASLRKLPPLAIQACLNNVIYIEKVIEYDDRGQIVCLSKHLLNPTQRARQATTAHLSKSYNIKFKFERKNDGIAFGDLLYKDKDNNEISIRDCLIEEGILNKDEKLFEGMADFINNYKENHLMVISKICYKEPYAIELEQCQQLRESCMNIVSKVLKEFDYNDLLNFEDECAEPLWLSKSLRNDTATSLDSSISDCETPVKTKSKKEKLMDMLWQHKTSPKSPSVVPTSKIKNLCEKLKQQKIKKEISSDSVKLKINNKMVFTPAGSERTFNDTKVFKKQRGRFSQEGSSSEPKVSKTNRNNHANSKGFINMDPFSECSDNSICPQGIKTIEKRKVCYNDRETSQNQEKESSLSDERETSQSEEIETSKSEGSLEASQENITENHVQRVSTLKIKPFCNCRQCNIWTKEENIFVENLPKHQKVDKITEQNKQFLFKEKENSNCNINICSIDYSSMKKMEKQSMKKILVHSESILKPIQNVSKLPFDRRIHQNLHSLDYKEAKHIQSYVWPAILRNQHVFMINGPQTGKTMAYLPVMCTFILEKLDRYHSLLKVAGGPIVIILCSDTRKCEEIYDLARVITGNAKINMALVTYPLAHVNTSHTDVLITTPCILMDLLKNKCVNFKKLCHLILEESDTILQKHKDQMYAIFELAQSMLKNRVFTKALQLIVCAEHWNSQIKSLLTSLQQVPVICIGNYLEAALYGKLEFSIKFINSSCKDQELRHLLKDSHRINRSIIICKEDEIEDIHEILRLKGIDNIPMSANLSQEDIIHYEVLWTEAKGGNYSVLICSDFILHTVLNITCATTLIHYSLPKSWTKFVKRFSCLLENCHSPFDQKEGQIISRNVVLCDETCKEQIHRFFVFINSTDLKIQLPEKLQQFSETIKQTEEEQKLEKRIGLCMNLKLFGNCNKMSCPKRHLINPDLDICDYLPKSGKIRFKIVDIIDVSSYSIQLLQHIDNENQVQEYEEFVDIIEDLTTTLRLSRKKINNPIVGHHYAFYNMDELDGTYYRCEMLCIDDDCVQVKLLDKGTIVNTMISRIYRLPQEFNCNVKPRATIDAFLANYVPPYNDKNYSAKAFFNLKTLLDQHNYKNIIFSAEVHLQLCHTLWIKEVYEEVILSDKIIPGYQLSREILLKKLVDSDPSQLKNLYKLCSESNITLPKYDKPKVTLPVTKEQVKLQWAHLNINKIYEVTFASAFSSDEIYVRLNKFSDLLYTLQKEIQQCIRKPNYAKLQEVNIGEVYLAKDSISKDYFRVLVLKKESEEVLCFSVDFGEELIVPIRELIYIQPELITKLPFQCIQCRLHGTKQFCENWETEATNILYEYAHEPGTDIFRTLYLKTCSKETSMSSGGNKYSIILKDGFGEKNILINQLLIDCGLVTTKEEEKIENFEIPIQKQESSDCDEENLEEIAYICEKTNELDQNVEPNGIPINKCELDFKLEEMELFIYGDAWDFFSKFNEREEPASRRTNELPTIKAALPTDYYTPKVYWFQTDGHIKLSIRLTDIIDYKLTLTKGRMLNFRTVKDQKTYCLKMMLYEMVETMQHVSAGPEIRITLNKVKHIEWPRLILSKQKSRNIHYDVMKIPVEEEKRKFLQLPKDLDNEDSEGLNEDDPMYTVVSDLDSDLDIELPNNSD